MIGPGSSNHSLLFCIVIKQIRGSEHCLCHAPALISLALLEPQAQELIKILDKYQGSFLFLSMFASLSLFFRMSVGFFAVCFAAQCHLITVYERGEGGLTGIRANSEIDDDARCQT